MHETIRRYFKAIKDLDVDAWVACFAPRCEHHDPVGGAILTSPAELRQFFLQISGLFETVELVPHKVFPSGEEVALTWTGSGRGKNGRDVAFEGIDVFKLNAGGQIDSLKAYWDMAPTIAVLTA